MNSSAVINSRIQWINSLLPPLTMLLLLLCLVIAGLIANMTVFVVMVRGGRFKRHLSNFMLFHLAITDIAYRLIVVPAQYISTLYPFETKPTIFCKVTKTFIYMFNTAVFSSLVIIACDRHQSITRPFKRLRHKPKFYQYLLVVGYSSVCAFPQMYNAGASAINVTSSYKGKNNTFAFHLCSPSNEGSSQRIVAMIYFVLGFLVPLLMITFAYSKIAVFLWIRSRNRMINQAALKSKGKALRMLVLVVVGFVVCLGAPQLFDLMKSFSLMDQVAITFLAFILQLSSYLIETLSSIPLFTDFILLNLKRG